MSSYKPFRRFLQESAADKRHCTFVFGRFNPPTIAHEALLDAATTIAKRSRKEYRDSALMILASNRQELDREVMPCKEKVKFLRLLFPKHRKEIVDSCRISSLLEAAVHVFDEGFTHATAVVGSNKVSSYNTLLQKFNGAGGKDHGYYDFSVIRAVSSGLRDPDVYDVSGISATAATDLVQEDDYENFAMIVPGTEKQKTALFQYLRNLMK